NVRIRYLEASRRMGNWSTSNYRYLDPEVTKWSNKEFAALEKISSEFEKQVSIFKHLLPPELHDPYINSSSVFYTSPTYSIIGQPYGCKQTSYEKLLRQSFEQFIIEEFEVIQVIKKE
ncbi:25190_t:CDS:2, partial [Gigaspora rosea]